MGTVAATVLAMALTVTPSNGGLIAPAQIKINVQPGDQFEPHVDLDVAAYSDAVLMPSGLLIEQIRYYDFPSNIDSAISNTLADGTVTRDLLSDIDQGRIVFTRGFPGRSAIMLFDTRPAVPVLTELAPTTDSNRMGVAIGGQTVAFIDLVDGLGEVMVLNLANPSVVTRLTTDSVSDVNVAVSTDGNVITWEHCVTFSNCDIYRAVRTAGVWGAAEAVTSSSLNEARPDTNGTTIVFHREQSSGPTGSNIVLAPVVGGFETVLEIAGEQYNPSIRGQLVAFESRVTTSANPDIYLVDLASNRMFQITNTLNTAESLNDVTVLPGGEVRLVWEARTSGGAPDIYGATFTLPPAVVTAPPVCRSVAIEATRFHSPTRSVDGNASFSPALSFAIPGSLPVTAGNAGNKKASLTIDLGATSVKCEYRSRSTQSHPSSPTQLGLASSYVLSRCEVVGGDDDDDDDGDNDDDDGHGDDDDDDDGHHQPRYTAGTVVSAVSVHLHIQNGDTRQPMTRVRVVLNEVCGTSTSTSPLEASNSIDGPQAAGCSSSGASLMPFLVAFAFLALMMRRPASSRLVVRQEQRRLSR